MQTHKQIYLESLNLTLDSQPSKGDEWEGVWSAQEDVNMTKMPREVPKSQPLNIYKCPQIIEPLGSHCCLPWGDRMCRSGVTERTTPVSSHWMSPRVIILNLVRHISTVTKWSALSQTYDWTRCSKSPNAESPRVCSFPERFHGVKMMIGRIRSMSTGHALASGQSFAVLSHSRCWCHHALEPDRHGSCASDP
jgi:hypothetical protein